MKLRSLYILSIIGLFLVVVIQLGGMIYAYDSYKNEAKRTLNECFRQAFIETVDNRVNNLTGFMPRLLPVGHACFLRGSRKNGIICFFGLRERPGRVIGRVRCPAFHERSGEYAENHQ